MTLANAARWLFRETALLPPPGDVLRGVARVIFHLDQALFLTWPAGLVALSLAVFPRRRSWLMVLPWALAVAVLSIGYPEIRGEALRQAYLAAQLAAVLVSIGIFVQWVWRREAFNLPRLTTLFIAVLDCGTVGTAYRFGPFARWDLAQAMYLVLFGSLVVTQGFAWILSKGSRSRSD